MNSNKYKNGKRQLEYSAGQFAFFDIGGVYDDPEDPIRHFTIASSPTEDFKRIEEHVMMMDMRTVKIVIL